VLNPITYTERIVGDFLRYQFTTYAFADRNLNTQMRRLLNLEETRNTPLLRGPYISLSRSFRKGAEVDGGAVSVALFDDRLEVWSTGKLPGGLNPERLKRVHESIPRNRLIADVFYRRGLIERWGRGTNKILAEARRNGCPEPEFEEIAGSFVVRLQPAGAQQEVPAGAFALNDRAVEILMVLRRIGPAKASEILAAVGSVPERTLRRELRRLRERGRIAAIGRGKATRYRVTDEEVGS